MKKIFFFLILFFFPFFVSASSVKNIEILNGTLSRKFEPTNNFYSVTLNENETELKLKYELTDKESSSTMKQEEDQTILEVTNKDGLTEKYVFYINKEQEDIPVFKELNTLNTPVQKEIPYLKWYIGLGCLIVISILFKLIVIGRTKKKRK